MTKKKRLWIKPYRLYSSLMLSATLFSSVVVPVAQADDFFDQGYVVSQEIGCEIDYGEDVVDESQTWELVLVNRDNKKSDSDFASVNLVSAGGQQVDSRIKEAVEAFLNEVNEKKNGFKIVSGYRSTAQQETNYEYWVNVELNKGAKDRAEAEKKAQVYIQPPGASEHMTGLAIDITDRGELNEMDASSIKILEEIGEKHGFIRRFKEKYKSSTGIGEEDWHFRYVGKKHAQAINSKDISLEDYVKELKAKAKQSSKSRKKGKSSSSSSALSGSEMAGLGDAGGPWTQPGTEQYKVAETAFRVLTEVFGLSGISASGWLGNMQAESEFNMKMVEAVSAYITSAGQGYGLVQFTPATRYLNSKFYKEGASLEEEVKNQMSLVWAEEFANKAVVAFQDSYPRLYPAINQYLPKAGSYQIEDWLDSSSTDEAVALFMLYERANFDVAHMDRRFKAAEVANKLFNKNNVKADPSKWKFGEGIDASHTPRINMASGAVDDEECEDVTDQRSASFTEIIDKWKEVLNFKSVAPGIGFGIDMDGSFGSQCFDLARYFVEVMLEDKDGKKYIKDFSGGNAVDLGDIATKWGPEWTIKHLGEAKVEDLRPGDILFGSLHGVPEGHVIVVLSEANENGEILSIEQNPVRPAIRKGGLGSWASWGYIRPPEGSKLADNPIEEEYINDAVPTYPGGWRGTHGVNGAPVSDEEIKQFLAGV